MRFELNVPPALNAKGYDREGMCFDVKQRGYIHTTKSSVSVDLEMKEVFYKRKTHLLMGFCGKTTI